MRVIVGQIGAGRTIEAVLADYPYLDRDDILEALRCAAWRAEEREIELLVERLPMRSELCYPDLGVYTEGTAPDVTSIHSDYRARG